MGTGFKLSGRVSYRQPAVLGVLFVLQGLCTGYFVTEIIVEYIRTGINTHTVTEAVVTLILMASLAFTFLELRATMQRSKNVENTLHVAAGAFKQVIKSRFSEWALSPSEAEVAMLTLKGFSIAEVADLRKSSPGTVRVQLSNVYSKSGAEDRAGFVSLFIDELIDNPLSKSGHAASTVG